jgi:hypothetical protein
MNFIMIWESERSKCRIFAKSSQLWRILKGTFQSDKGYRAPAIGDLNKKFHYRQ